MVGVFFHYFLSTMCQKKNYSKEDFLRKCLRRPVFFFKVRIPLALTILQVDFELCQMKSVRRYGDTHS